MVELRVEPDEMENAGGALGERTLRGGVVGPVEAVGQPEHLRGGSRAVGGIGEIEVLAAVADHLDAVVSRLREAGGGGEIEIGPERALQRGKAKGEVAGRVIPITRPLR